MQTYFKENYIHPNLSIHLGLGEGACWHQDNYETLKNGFIHM
jgi:hypothetical protein